MEATTYIFKLSLFGLSPIPDDQISELIQNEYSARNVKGKVTKNYYLGRVEVEVQIQSSCLELAKGYVVDELFQIVCACVQNVEGMSIEIIDVAKAKQ